MYSNSDLKPACSLEDPELWFSTLPSKIKEAKAHCSDCVFKMQCLEECLDYEELSGGPRYGVFGGTTAEERAKLRSKRNDKRQYSLATKSRNLTLKGERHG